MERLLQDLRRGRVSLLADMYFWRSPRRLRLGTHTGHHQIKDYLLTDSSPRPGQAGAQVLGGAAR